MLGAALQQELAAHLHDPIDEDCAFPVLYFRVLGQRVEVEDAHGFGLTFAHGCEGFGTDLQPFVGGGLLSEFVEG